MKLVCAWTRWATILSALGLTACVTTYQPNGYTGGYKEEPAGLNRWYVSFYGNGNTTKDTVTVYGLYRCAELTALKGFDYFVLMPGRKPPDLSERDDGQEGAEAARDADIVLAKGGGTYIPVYIPGGTVTTWSWRGLIEMHKGNPEREYRPHFVAREVLDKLGPLVRDASEHGGRNITLPKNLFAGREKGKSPPAHTSAPVKLEDLDGLLSK